MLFSSNFSVSYLVSKSIFEITVCLAISHFTKQSALLTVLWGEGRNTMECPPADLGAAGWERGAGEGRASVPGQ